MIRINQLTFAATAKYITLKLTKTLKSMKQLPLIIGLVVIIIIGWYFMGNGNSSQYDNDKKPKAEIFNILDSFYSKYPNYGSNKQTQKTFTDTLNNILIRNGVKKIYNGIVFKLQSVEETKDKQYPYIGIFEYDELSDFNKSDISHNFKTSVLLDKKAADTLVDRDRYYIYGETVKVLSPAEIVTNKIVYLPNVRIRPDSIVRFTFFD
ncbi:MAG: hypothetical protein BGN92_09840 [Sphingobacteriales bacterium 41-5]|nr:MAG: hypothetical protein BGN92_09840 [Sphingobacteriales bacterium 41-5]